MSISENQNKQIPFSIHGTDILIYHKHQPIIVHPGKLTWNLKITCLKREIIFQTLIFGCHANFQRCRYICTIVPWVVFFGWRVTVLSPQMFRNQSYIDSQLFSPNPTSFILPGYRCSSFWAKFFGLNVVENRQGASLKTWFLAGLKTDREPNRLGETMVIGIFVRLRIGDGGIPFQMASDPNHLLSPEN